MEPYKKILGKVSLTAEGVYDSNREYSPISVVTDEETDKSYISRKIVPPGTQINNREYWQPIASSGIIDNGVIILNRKNSDGQVPIYDLKSAAEAVAVGDRKGGVILGFLGFNPEIDTVPTWKLYQYNDVSPSNWTNIDYWLPMDYTNKYAGWFDNEEALYDSVPFPKVGMYAYVGNSATSAIIYRCYVDRTWQATEDKAFGGVVNLADEEDITSKQNKLKFKDKEYNPAQFSGLGKLYLRKNIVDGNNVLTQTMIQATNTIYIIQYDYDLQGETITIPEGCMLDFQGGCLDNGSVVGNNTAIKAELVKIFGLDINLSGSWNITEGYPEWFGAIGDGVIDDFDALQKTINEFNHVKFANNKTYYITNTIICNHSIDMNYSTIKKDNAGYIFAFKLSVKYLKNGTLYSNNNASGIDMCANASHFDLIENINFKNLKEAFYIGRWSWCKTLRNIHIWCCGTEDTNAFIISAQKPEQSSEGDNHIYLDGFSLEGDNVHIGLGGVIENSSDIIINNLHLESLNCYEALTINVHSIIINNIYAESHSNTSIIKILYGQCSIRGGFLGYDVVTDTHVEISDCIIPIIGDKKYFDNISFINCLKDDQRITQHLLNYGGIGNSFRNLLYKIDFNNGNKVDSDWYAPAHSITNLKSDGLNENALQIKVNTSGAFGGGFGFYLPQYVINKSLYVTVVHKSLTPDLNGNLIMYSGTNYESYYTFKTLISNDSDWCVSIIKLTFIDNLLRFRLLGLSGGAAEIGSTFLIDSIYISEGGSYIDNVSPSKTVSGSEINNKIDYFIGETNGTYIKYLANINYVNEAIATDNYLKIPLNSDVFNVGFLHIELSIHFNNNSYLYKQSAYDIYITPTSSPTSNKHCKVDGTAESGGVKLTNIYIGKDSNNITKNIYLKFSSSCYIKAKIYNSTGSPTIVSNMSESNTIAKNITNAWNEIL